MTQLSVQNGSDFEPDLTDIIRRGNNIKTSNPALESNNEPDLSEIINKGRSQEPAPTPAAMAAQSVNAAGRYSQQQISAARQHAATLGMPFDEVLQHADAAGQLAGQVGEQDLQGFNPRTLEALQGKARYAARQDLPALNMLAQALDEAEWPYAQPQFPQQAQQQPQGPQLFATPTSGLERMGIRIQEGTRELGDAMANSVLGMVEGYAKHLRRGMDAEAAGATEPSQGLGWLDTIGRAITDSAQPVSQPDAQMAQGIRAALVPVLENVAQKYRSNLEAQQNTRNAPLAPAQSAVQRYTEDVVKMAPQMAAQTLAFIGFGPAASTMFMGAQIGGQAYDEMRGKGVDADTALVASLADAAMQAPLEQFGLEKALSVFKASGVWNAVKSIAGAAGTEFLTEWAQQYPDEIAHIWAETTQKGQGFEQGFKTFVDRLGEMTLEGMYQGAVAAPWGALFGGVGMMRNGKAPAPQLAPEMQQFFTRQAQEANTMLARQGLTVALDAAAQHLDNLETRRQGPEALAEMLGELLPENFRQTWLGPDDAATLYQHAQENGQEAELLDALGTDAQTMQQTLDNGAPLPVDTAAVLAKAQPEARAQITQAMRVTPDGASGAEAAKFDPAARTQEAVRRVVEGAESINPTDPAAVLAQARSAQKLHADVNRETTRLAQQIEAVGYPRHVAKANAELLAQNALAMQAAYGLPADETLHQVSYTRAENTDQQEGAHYQLDDNGNAVSPGEASPRIAPVVSVDPSIIVDADGKPVDLKNNEALLAWLRAQYQGKSVTITDDGQKVEFTRRGMDASLKRRGPEQRQAYAELDNLVSGALYDDFEKANERHKGKVAGQNVYYSAAKIGDNYFAVRIKVDMPARDSGRAAYKDHKVTGIEIAPSLYRGRSPQVGSTQDESAIRGISLSVLKGDVKPSRIEGGTLFQQDGKTPLGSVTFTPQPQSAAVRIFPGANLSTIPHESAHIFFENLTRIAADDGSVALRALRTNLANAVLGEKQETKDTVRKLLTAALQAKQEGRAAALQTLAAEFRSAAANAKQTHKQLGEDITAMQQQAQEQGIQYDTANPAPWVEPQIRQYHLTAQGNAFARAERAVKKAIRHLDGLEQARADLHTLRQYAGIADDADITPGTEDYTKLHEGTARAFEQYLMEGKAPSQQLKGVFSRMRAWLLDVYKQARDVLGLPITDPVRRVFERMLATDQQIRQSRQLQGVLSAEQQFAEQFATTQDAMLELEQMRNQAELEVQAAMDRATLNDRNQRYKAYYAAALDALDASPWWQMVADLSARRRDETGNSFGGLDRDSMARYIGAEMTAELSRMRPGLINAQGNGLPVDVAAQEYGYEGGDALATELYDSLVGRRETKKGLAKSQADQAMQSEDSLAEQEAILAGGESYGAYLDRVDEEVLRIAAQRGYRTVEEQERFVRNSITPRSRIKNQAFNIIQNTPLRDITPARYQAMLDKALRDRQAALLDGNVMQAVNAVENARVANELIWSAQYQISQREAMLQLAGETAAAKPGTFPSVHTAALRKLLNQYGLANVRGAADPDFAPYSLRDLVQQTIPQDVVDVMPSFAGWLLDARDPNTGQTLQNGFQKFSDLTPNQMQEVDNLLKYLRKTGYDARTDARNSEAAKIQMQVNQSAAAMQSLKELPTAAPDTLRGKSQEATRKMSAAVDALRWQFRKADGFVNIMGDGEAGGMEKLHDQMLMGEQRIRTRIDGISSDMAPHLAQLWESVQAWEKKYGKNLMVKDANGQIVAPPESLQKAYGRKTWTADMVLAVAFNVGNASNMARLTSGYDLKYEMLAPLLGDQMAAKIMSAGQEFTMRAQGSRPGLLSVADWQAVQGIWDALHTQWADTQAVHERMYGFKPQGVEPTALTITDTSTGQVASLRGGYYPVRYDPKVSDKVAQWGEQEDLMSRNESMFAVPSAKRGHTQARTDRAPGLPLRLDTGIIMEHISDVVRLIELGEVVRRADRITQNPQFRAEYVRAFGQADYDAIRPNLRGMVRKEPPPKSDMVVSLANTMRKYLVPWGLSWNLKVAALQMTAVFPAMGDIGASYVLHGMGYMTAHRMQAMRQIWEASPYMKSRMDNIDQDLQRNIANFSPSKREKSITIAGKEISWEDVVNAGMWPIGAVDAVATSAVWIGAYNKKLSQLHGEKVKYGLHTDSEFHQQAVDYADNMVKQSNPDFDPSSRSGFLRAQNAYRLVNNFASAITLFAARHKFMYAAHAKGKISLGQIARFEAYETLLPAASMFLFLALARGYFGGDDKDKKELAKLAMSTFTDQATMRVPMFGNVVGDGLLAVLGMDEGGQKGGGIRTALDEPTRQIANITGKGGRAAWHGVKNDEQAKALVYAAGDIASFLARVPVSKLIRAGERGYKQWQDGRGTPASIIMPRPGK